MGEIRNAWKDLGIHERISLKWILQKYGVRLWNGFRAEERSQDFSIQTEFICKLLSRIQITSTIYNQHKYSS